MRHLNQREPYRYLPALRLYRADLDRICALLSNEGSRTVMITSRGYAFDSFEEMRTELGPVIRELVIRGGEYSEPYFELRPDGEAVLFSGSDSYAGSAPY